MAESMNPITEISEAQNLSTLLRERTAAAHSQAEESNFMDDLLAGRASAAAWTALAVQLYPVYVALEKAAAELAAHPLVAPLHDPALNRTAELARDIESLLGAGAVERIGSEELPLLPATQAYVATLADAPSAETVVANHYVRYLGDLSGGQIIATMLRRHYGVADEALHFYRFAGIDKLKLYKDEYRAALDALPADGSVQEEIVAAAIAAFSHNQAVFRGLEDYVVQRVAG